MVELDEPREELPPPSAELVLIHAMGRAYLRSVSRRRRMAFLQDVTSHLEEQIAGANVFKIRPASQAGALKDARLKARSYWRELLGVLISGME